MTGYISRMLIDMGNPWINPRVKNPVHERDVICDRSQIVKVTVRCVCHEIETLSVFLLQLIL